MNKETAKVMKKIVKLSKRIAYLYGVLQQLEFDKLKESPKFQETILELTQSLEEEILLYEYFEDKINEAISADEYLQSFDLEDMNLISIALAHDKDINISTRISNHLNTIILSNPKKFAESLAPEEIDCIENEDKEDGEEFLAEIIPTMELSTWLTLSSFIEDAIKVENDPEVLNHLIKTKYALSFVDIDIESIYLENSFEKIPSEFALHMENGEYDVDDETVEFIKNNHGFKFIGDATRELLPLHDEDYNNKITYARSIVLICLLQISTLFLSEKMKKLIYENLLNQIAINCNMASSYKKDTFITGIITNIFESTAKIREQANKDFAKPLEY